MSVDLTFGMAAVLIGGGATLFMDLWAALQNRLLGVPSLNYALVGRWIGHLWLGRFSHENIAAAPPTRGETALRWFAHYAIGVVFATMLLAVWGIEWARNPTPGPALLVGVVTVSAPFLILQPAMAPRSQRGKRLGPMSRVFGALWPTFRSVSACTLQR